MVLGKGMRDLSIIIPARNEMFVSQTVDSILQAVEADTEIIVALDGQWAEPPIKQNDRITVIYFPEIVGQRAACNAGASISRAKYIMKVDAHCSFDKGFDRKLIADMQDDWCVVPIMKNLHAFDWVCTSCGHRKYQGPTPEKCDKCKGKMNRVLIWEGKKSPQSTAYAFDTQPKFEYFGEFKKRKEGHGDLTETMSLQGSCFMVTRDMYHRLNLCDESLGTWGSQGIEVACKMWLSGGRVVVNHKTWYAHMFRTQGGDFVFPYHLSGKQVDYAKKQVRELFFGNAWDKQVHPIHWLIEKFWPVPGWTQADLDALKVIPFKVITKGSSKGIVYYTDNRLAPEIDHAVRRKLDRAGLPIVSVSLQPMDWHDNIHLPLERGYLTMFKQILAGLEVMDTDIVFLCEHDILYHPSHFEFVPPRSDLFYYNTNVWKVDSKTGHALYYDCQQTSGLCANRDLLLRHYRKRVEIVERIGFSRRMGFEPGTHGRKDRVDDYKAENWQSEYPNIDIRHDHNLTPTRWRKDQFRNQRYCHGWIESDIVPGWGTTKGRFTEILSGANK